MAKDKTQTSRVWIFVVDSRNSNDLSDLDHLEDIWWGSNPHTRQGDIVLMYRTAPYSDIAYVFSATSNPRPAEPADGTDMSYVIELGEKTRLSNPITLSELRNNARLSQWSFVRHQQGVMRRTVDITEEGFWQSLRALIVKRNPRILEQPGRARGRRQLRVFISYSSPDIEKVRNLYDRLRKERGLNLWFDRESLTPGDNWKYEITRAIYMSDMIVICLSAGSLRRRGFSQKEIQWALEKADEQPFGTTTIVPVKLEPCNVPPRLAKVAQYAELFNQDAAGYERIVASLRKRSALLEETGTK